MPALSAIRFGLNNEKGRAFWPSPFLAASYSSRRKLLEAETQPHLYCSRSVRLHRSRDHFASKAAQRTPIGRIPNHIVRIAQVRRIEDVGEVGVEFQLYALCARDSLADAKIHVPIRL